MSPTYFIDAALSGLPKPETDAPVTQDTRDYAAVRRYLENAATRLRLVEKRQSRNEGA